MIVPRGMGDDTAVNPLDLSVNELASYVPGFLSQPMGPLPTWAWFGGAILMAWWFLFPHGSEYRKRKHALASDYTGVGRIRKRRKKVSGGLRQAFT